MAGTPIDREVLGDWSNLKGTRYHLVYALWLLLRERVPAVRFYVGNDLHASPAAPPAEVSPAADPVPAVAADAVRPATDVWIQLKATREPWTVSQLLDDNLLANFVCNAAASEHAGRGWDARLVTEAEVRGDEVREFLADPAAHPRHEDRLRVVLAAADRRLRAQPWFEPDRLDLRITAEEVLARLAAAEPTPLRMVKAEVEFELALACPDRAGVHRLASALIGALVLDAGAGPAAARAYTPAWLNEQAGRAVVRQALFDIDPAAGCDAQVRAALKDAGPSTPDARRYVPRPQLSSLLEQFLTAPEPVFVLLGRSGAGKSSGVARWAADALAGHRRLLVRRPDPSRLRSVAELVADALSGLTERGDRPGELLAVFAAAPTGTAVLIVDDVRATAATRDEVARAVSRFARGARDAQLKLVVACQSDLWEALRLGAELSPALVFRPDSRPEAVDRTHSLVLDDLTPDEAAELPPALGLPPDPRPEVIERPEAVDRTHSLVLDDFTPDEVADAVHRARPGTALGGLARRLTHPAYAPLRRPYLLARYLDLNPDPGVGVEVGRLLDEVAAARVREVAVELGLDEASVAAGLRAVAVRLLDGGGPTPADLARILDHHAPGGGQMVLAGLRRVGVVDTRYPAGWADETLGTHLAAGALLDRPDVAERVACLDPLGQGGIAEVAVRDAPAGPELGAGLVRRDRRWQAAVATGLASRRAADPQAIGLLLALTAAGEDRVPHAEGCAALGFLAARGGSPGDARRVWRRVAELYLSADAGLRIRGAAALAAAFDLHPARAARYVRHRLDRELRARPRFDRHDLGRRLADALRPVHRVEHRAAAEAAAGLLGLIEPAVQNDLLPDHGVLVAAVDDLRGRVAVHAGGCGVAALVADLQTADRLTRVRAAGALRPVVAQAPETVRTEVLGRVRAETDGVVLMRLIWSCHPYLASHAREVVAAVAAGAAGRWDDAVPTGAALAILGDASRHAPAAAAAALPARLDRLTPDERAWFSDVLALAWWRCWEHYPPAREALAALRQPDLAGVTDAFRVFAHRGAFVARLGGALGGLGAAGEVQSWMLTRHGEGVPYCYSDLDDLVGRHAAALAAGADLPGLLDALVQTVTSHHGVEVNVLDTYFVNARFVPARDAVDDLARLAARLPDPVAVLARLPRDWEAMRAARLVLAAGVATAPVVAFAAAACEEHAHSGTAQAHHERGLCRAALALLDPPRGDAGGAAGGRLPFFSGGGLNGDRVERLAALGDNDPDRLLATLEGTVREAADIPALVGWLGRTRSWGGFLLARAFRRMFSPRPLAAAHAADLTRDVLAVLDALPDSPERAEWAGVYRAIQSWFDGRPGRVAAVVPRGSIFSASHAVAAEVLNRAVDLVSAGGVPTFGPADFLDARLWWQSPNFRVEGDGLSFGAGGDTYLIYALPAVRLAFAAARAGRTPADPAGAFMRARYAAGTALAAVEHAVRFGEQGQPGLAGRLAEADELNSRYPWDERIDRLRGNLLVRLGRYREAEEALRRCVDHPLAHREWRCRARYDRACAAAREGRLADCERELTAALREGPGLASQISADLDFDSVRGLDWFTALLPPPGTGR